MNVRNRHAFRLSLPVLIAVTLGACGGSGGGGASSGATIHLADPGPTVFTVNGEPVPQKLLDALARRNNWDLSKPELRDRAVKELTNYMITAQAAHTEKFDTDPNFIAAIELNRLQGLATAAMAEFQRRGEVDDSVLHAEYDKQITKAGSAEYDFGNIVFASQAEAAKAITELKPGKSFNDLIEAHKKDARMGRMFTKIRGAQLPEPVAKALEGMKPGETSKTPVESKFGWHVLQLTAATPYTPPAFDQVKDNLRRSLVKRAGEERMAKLREEAKITYTDPSMAPSATPPKPAMPGGPLAPKPAGPATPAPADAGKPQG